MKKILIISLLLCGTVLAGCSQQKQLSKSELFEKKQECSSYRDQMIKDLAPNYMVDTTDFIKEIF